MKNILIFGSGGHAKMVTDILEATKQYKIVGYIAPASAKHDLHYPILGDESALAEIILKQRVHELVIAIGDNALRAKVEAVARKQGLVYARAVHPRATVSPVATIGEGTVVMANAVINPSARIGRHCIVNTGAIIEHDCVLEDYSSVGPGACLGGAASLGEFAVVGINATLLQGVAIGANSVLGSAALATRSVPANSVAYGVPAKVVRSRAIGEKYL